MLLPFPTDGQIVLAVAGCLSRCCSRDTAFIVAYDVACYGAHDASHDAVHNAARDVAYDYFYYFYVQDCFKDAHPSSATRVFYYSSGPIPLLRLGVVLRNGNVNVLRD